MRTEATYESIRREMRPGDLIAFSKNNPFSLLIRGITRSPICHVGTILLSRMVDEYDGPPRTETTVMLAETSAANGVPSTCIRRFSERVVRHSGTVWWLPLREEYRKKLDLQAMYSWLLKREGSLYDLAGVAQLGWSILWGEATRKEKLENLFCSELVVGALEAGGVVSEVNASGVTPADLCSWNVWGETYYQIAGEPKEIPVVGTKEPFPRMLGLRRKGTA